MENFFIDYIVSQIPVWFWPFVAVLGVIANLIFRVLEKLPYIAHISLIGKPVSAVVVLLAVFMTGGAGVNAVYQDHIKKIQAEVDVANQQEVKTEVRIQKVIVQKIKVVQQTQVKVVHDVQRDAVVIDKECKVAKEAIIDLNEAAR
jgi:hypothetical protein